MEKIPTDISTSESIIAPTASTETRTLREVVYGSKRIGGSYGSLAKSQLQPTFYISHNVEPDDTLQRLALKYSINIQEIKRVNKLWSDAELRLLEHVYIPVNSFQLSTLRTIYPTLDVMQNLPSSTNHLRKGSMTNNEITSSDSSTSISTTINSSYLDYFSKIDQQIKSTKKSLQSLDINDQHRNNDTHTSDNNHSTMRTNERHKGAHHLSDNSVFVNVTTQNSRERHVSAALKRLQRENDTFDEL